MKFWNGYFCRVNNKPSLNITYLCSMFYHILFLSASSFHLHFMRFDKLLNTLECQNDSEVEFMMMKLRLTLGLAPMWRTSNWTFNAILSTMAQFVRVPTKVIYTKYSKHWPYTVAHTIEIKNNKARHKIRIVNTVRWP